MRNHNEWTRREFLASTAAAAIGPNAGIAQSAPTKPNIVFILADDLGYGDLGCYGQERIATPNIDRIASEGMRFTQTYSGSTVCAPSRCCLMTGRHSGHSTVRGNKKPEVGLRAGEVTLASLLRDAGYETALFGKWGLGGPGTGSVPNTRGFDEFYGFLDQQHAHNSFPEHLWDNQNETFLTANWFNRRKVFAPDLFTEHALAFLKRPRQKPFFLCLTTTAPHADNELGAASGSGIDVPDDVPYTGREWPQVEKNFAALITRMDRDVGRVLDTLREVGLDRNTIVFFSSDNGPHAEGGHDPKFFRSSGALRGIKRDLYEGGIRVPALVRWPGVIKPGLVKNDPWAFWDLLPTAAELAGVSCPAGLDGISMLPLLTGKALPARDHLYWEFHEKGFHQAVRRGDWKLVRQGGKAPELYNVAEDISETKDVADRYPDTAKQLRELFEKARTPSRDFPTQPTGAL